MAHGSELGTLCDNAWPHVVVSFSHFNLFLVSSPRV